MILLSVFCIFHDSFENKALVLSRYNGEKDDKYPIDPSIQVKMGEFWEKLHENGLIGDEKYRRLTRKTSFTDEELMGFINRQIVETRQSTKAVATLLKSKYPEIEIVYVKAGLVSDFRHEFKMMKCRTINDFHHAKDAYLNIVVGNVYHAKFTQKWFKLTDTYSMRTSKIFEYPVKHPDGHCVWTGGNNLDVVRKNYSNNHVHVTRYAFCRKGGLFDQMPKKATEGLIPRKMNLPAKKYGGYRKPTAGFFCLVKYNDGKKYDVMIMPVELMYAENFKTDLNFREEYSKQTIKSVFGKDVNDVSFPMGDRIIKVNTVFELDGIRMCISGKKNGGRTLSLNNITPFICDANTEEYIRFVEKFADKAKDNPGIKYDASHSSVTCEKNIALYNLYIEKLGAYPFNNRPANPVKTLINGNQDFKNLSVIDQVKCLSNIHPLFCRLAGGTDLTLVGGKANEGESGISSKLSNWNYSQVFIVDQSASGLFEKKSENLLDLL